MEFYDSVEDLPITQFHRYSKYLLVESGIGDTISDIDRHISRIVSFLGDERKARAELMNLRQCLYAVATEQDISNKAVLCLVRSVDGKKWEDFSEQGLESLYSMIRGTSLRELNEIASKIREAIDENLVQYFPSVFEDSLQKNYSDLLRRKALLQVEAIVRGEDRTEEIREVERSMARMQGPKQFSGAESEEIKFDKEFEDMCLVMAKEFGGGIKQFTTMEFYTAFERLSRQAKEAKKIRNKK